MTERSISECLNNKKNIIGNIKERISLLSDSFPQVLFPNTFEDSLTSLCEDASYDDLRDKCLNINYLDEAERNKLQKIDTPQQPPKPCLRNVSTTKTIHIKKRRLSDIFDNTGDTLLTLWLLPFVLMPLIVFGIVIVQFWRSYFSLKSLIFAIPLGIVGIILLIRFIRKRCLDTYYDDLEIPCSIEELNKRKEIEQNRYNAALLKYQEQQKKYEEDVVSYNKALKEQIAVIKDILPHLLASYIIGQSLIKSCDYSVVDEGPQRGKSEDKLFVELMKVMPKSVHIDTRIAGYYPDLMVSTSNDVYIDIEIDEPYDMETHKEIHYIGGSDEERNKRLCEKGWIVLRFSEKQVLTDCIACVKIIQLLTMFVESGKIDIFNDLTEACKHIKDKRWTKEDARLMAINNYRRTY